MLELTRFEDWPERLVATVDRHRAAAFAWGRFDCATFFADAVLEMTGTDPLEAFRGWVSERSARTRLIKAGYKSMQDFAGAQFREIPPSLAGRGDIGFTDDAVTLACPAVITGADAMSRDADGWIVFPAVHLTRAFKVG